MTYNIREIFIANLMDDCLDRDKILSAIEALQRDCERFGIEIKDKPIRQLLQEVSAAEKKVKK